MEPQEPQRLGENQKVERPSRSPVSKKVATASTEAGTRTRRSKLLRGNNRKTATRRKLLRGDDR